MESQPKRPSLHLVAEAGTGSGSGVGAATAEMSGAYSPTSGFLPDMPQWKKDLIQRRKTNVARTQAAASPTATSDVDVALGESSASGGTVGGGAGASAEPTATEATITSQPQQKPLAKRNVSQPATAAAHLQMQAALKTTPTEEKSEKSFIGGHHTQQQQQQQQLHQGKDSASALAFSISAETTFGPTATGNPQIPIPIPKQRSSLFNTRSPSTTTTATSSSSSSSGSKEPEILNLDLRERERESEREPGEQIDSMVSYRSRGGGEVETGTAAAAATGALTAIDASSGSGVGALAAAPTSSSSANHLQTKLGQTVSEGAPNQTSSTAKEKELQVAAAIATAAPATPLLLVDNKNGSKTKLISDKLQSNKFIKQQQEQQQQHQHQQQQHQQQLSPTKSTVKTTMVAMQEMKKTTKQNGQHRHIAKSSSNSSHSGDTEAAPGVALPALVDTGEDLSYGPGIVSKLRCRYLSLALRESHQQNQKQRLQRSTSLNTLLDRDDDEEEINANAGLEVVSTRAKSTPPPILGAKPTMLGGGYIKGAQAPVQRPVSLGTNGTTPTLSALSTEDSTKPTNGGGGGGVNRSRHFKRGNEVMKRARSVEALLCEKSPWNTQRASYQATSMAMPTAPQAVSPGAASPTCVTIEDKIHNARERLHSGTDTAPPKRLTSIIDDTERPPPDLVKQTLKMFEASANRRPRATHRSNGVGGVASKVANYKSILKEQRSPAPSVGSTPPSLLRREPGQSVGFAASTPKQATRSALISDSSSSTPHPHPDIIPRQLASVVDSPVTALSLMMGRINLQDADGEAAAAASAVNESLVSEARAATASGTVAVAVPVAVAASASATTNNEANSEYENENENNGRHDVGNDGDDDNTTNDNNRNDSDNNGHDGDNMGAAGDKPKPPTSTATTTTAAAAAATAAGGAQRSFVATIESAHVPSGSNIARKQLNNIETGSGLGSGSGSSGITSTTTTTKQIGVIRPLFNSSGTTQQLTSREIEKNRINEMKKSSALANDGSSGAGSPITSLDTVINSIRDGSETDAASASPLWTLRKLRHGHAAGSNSGHHAAGTSATSSHSTENTSMVFNFSKSTKEVPDYIESDVVIYRRKRELPKPNEPGFVLLGDLSVETSTDTDYDDYSLCPPSPCDVEFENANIVIDGKSSIRQKPKESSFRVQFNDTLTSTFEYPSEASMVIDDPPYADPFSHVSKHHQLLLAEQMQLLQHQQQVQQQQQQHHHVTVDEIIELPTSTVGNNRSGGSGGGGNMLGNLPLGSTALGFYTPMKASPMDSLFQLGVTRYAPPDSSSSSSSSGGGVSNNSSGSNSNNSSNGCSPACGGGGSSGGGGKATTTLFNGNGSIVGLGEGLIKDGGNCADEEDAAQATTNGAGGKKGNCDADGEDDDYHPTATPGGGVVYSEGTQKTDLLY
ncbi:serine-rich adhesin for platelets isoform X2 [Drosophila subobscura]|uniref:serine-rich adhesin for platelets isoform X2 n=1 Tax=Drosophila subobscura TaxID=7241 RepID=UPI00155A09BB|nr:serine-rich adhesin for platelets isoform X2 [Drosophila subobscura]